MLNGSCPHFFASCPCFLLLLLFLQPRPCLLASIPCFLPPVPVFLPPVVVSLPPPLFPCLLFPVFLPPVIVSLPPTLFPCLLFPVSCLLSLSSFLLSLSPGHLQSAKIMTHFTNKYCSVDLKFLRTQRS